MTSRTSLRSPYSLLARPRAALLLALVAALVVAWQLPFTVSAASVESTVSLEPVDASIHGPAMPPAGAPPTFAEVIAAVEPAVVNISTERRLDGATYGNPGSVPGSPRMPGSPPMPGGPFDELFRRFFDAPHPGPGGPRRGNPDGPTVQSSGSGFIVSADGWVVTNHHVVQGSSEVTVTLQDGSRHSAKVRGADAKTDLAVLELDVDEPLPFARLGDSDGVRTGDWVIAIGNPFGLGGTATTGIVSARGRDINAGPYDDFLQIDAPINRGNSGGPLFDLEGRVVGINTAIYSPNGGSVGIGFAIPATQASPVIEQLRSSGHVERGWLGVGIQGVDEDIAAGLGLESAGGALISSVEAQSPADRAGLEVGDVVRRVDGEEIEELKDLTRAVAAIAPDDKVELGVWRGSELETLSVRVGRSPDSPPKVARGTESRDDGHSSLGLSLADLDDSARRGFGISPDVEGALVVGVEQGSEAANRGLRPGDVVVRVGRTAVESASQAADEIAAVTQEDRETVLLQVARGEARRFVPLSLG